MRNGLLGYALGLVLFLFSVGLLDARSQTTASGGTVVVAAGDISCDPNNSDYNNGQGSARRCRMKATSDLAVSMNPSAVLVLGDTQYERGALDAFQKSWVNNWGRKELKDMTYPSVGNHEYKTKDASGYFDFFGARAGERGKGYYSFTLGAWHIIALNSGGNNKCQPISCVQGSDQEKWLREDLGKNNSACTLAFWHRPLFTSGLHRGAVELKPMWEDLYAAGADVILNGHSHQYERFAPQNPDGGVDPRRGITQFVVGTGGKNLKGFWRIRQNSVARNSDTYGVLRLTLREKSYDWQFVSEHGEVLDSGAADCHPKTPSIKNN